MSVETRLYKVAGMSRCPQGSLKVRYSGEDLEERIKLYAYLKHTDILFFELPKPMNKVDICKLMLSGGVENLTAEQRKVIEVELGKKEKLVAPKVPQKRGPKPKAKTAAAKPTAKAVTQKKIAAVKAAPVKPAPKKAEPDRGEIETLEVIEDTDVDDFDIRQFERLAAEQV